MNAPNSALTTCAVDRDQLRRIEDQLAADVERRTCDGVALRVSVRGELVLDFRTGYADRELGKPVVADTVFAAFSTSKQLCSVAALIFVERGLLRLHTTVAELIPEFGTLGKHTINLHHLLTHTSGLAPDVPVPPFVLAAAMDNSLMVQEVAKARLLAQPGERVSYQAIVGHAVVAEMLERVDPAGRSYVDIVDDEILRPLGMTETTMGVTRPELVERFAPVRACYDTQDLFDPAEVAGVDAMVRLGAVLPAGGYVTTISDLHRFTEMLTSGGTLDGRRIVAPATLDYASRNQTGAKPNDLVTYTSGRGWNSWPANIGTGFFVRGDGETAGPVGNFASGRTLAGMGAGTAGFIADGDHQVSMTLLTTGAIPDADHVARLGRLSDMVIAAL